MTTGWRDRPANTKAERKLIERYERRFRHYILCNSNPRGRIVRLPCTFCGDMAAEAHHLKYEPDWAFIVVWTCVSCHRKIEHGSLKVRRKHVYDYTSLVASVARPGGRVENRREPDTSFDFGFNVVAAPNGAEASET